MSQVDFSLPKQHLPVKSFVFILLSMLITKFNAIQIWYLMAQVIHGLAALGNNKDWQQRIKGNVGYLCNSASVDCDLTHGITVLKKLFNHRF